MPQTISSILEPHTSLIEERIKAIADFKAAGYDVHLNFSPIVVYENWLSDYSLLFSAIDRLVPESIKLDIKAEGIFLTHNQWQHERNLANGRENVEQLIWQPHQQEEKLSTYGSEALRYRYKLKEQYIRDWQELHNRIIPWNQIRYIF